MMGATLKRVNIRASKQYTPFCSSVVDFNDCLSSFDALYTELWRSLIRNLNWIDIIYLSLTHNEIDPFRASLQNAKRMGDGTFILFVYRPNCQIANT